MINPTVYEHLAARLAQAAEEATLTIGTALTTFWRRVIENPETVYQLEPAFVNTATKTSRKWASTWRDWTDDELAAAYLLGIKHTDAEINLIKAQGINLSRPDPTGKISPTSPLASKLPAMTPPLPIPRKLEVLFSGLPDHLTFYGTFRRAAHFNLEGTNLQIIRSARDLVRDIAVRAGDITFREGDVFTRRILSQKMLDDFAKRGITSVIYSDGRKMSLTGYAEMTGRTVSGRAAVQASLNRYEQYGYDLLRVSAHFQACDLCDPWEGQILSHSGMSDRYPSLDEAIGAGLYHHNCAHDITPYFPGISPPQDVPLDPEHLKLIEEHGYTGAQRIAYKAQQRQRAIERHVRNWKMREVTALDPTAAAKAKQKVFDWQAAQRSHISNNPFLRRDYARESIKRAV